jgi:hypothetical protein
LSPAQSTNSLSPAMYVCRIVGDGCGQKVMFN